MGFYFSGLSLSEREFYIPSRLKAAVNHRGAIHVGVNVGRTTLYFPASAPDVVEAKLSTVMYP